MIVLTLTLSNRKVRRISAEIEKAHSEAIDRLRQKGVIRLEFEDRLLQQAEFLLNLSRDSSMSQSIIVRDTDPHLPTTRTTIDS